MDEADTSGDFSTVDGTIEDERALVFNPVSGDSGHGDQVRELAAEHGFTVLETEREGEAVDFSRRAAEGGASMVVAAGGDGTVNEVVHGLNLADAFDSVTFGVVPTGTGNNFAGNVGITGIEHAFEMLEDGERRRIDVGTADGRTFVNSCVGGLTAAASGETDSEQKERLGVLAYVVETLRLMSDFEGLKLRVEAGTNAAESWSGHALFVLVGNGRRFPAEGRTQANMEDGQLEVTIIEKMPAKNLLSETTAHRLFGSETEHVTSLKAPRLDIAAEDDEPVQFSLDGEMGAWKELTLGVRSRVLELPVGPKYEPVPDGD
ncbi:diacylglycerol/lipid kinase family protein [Halomicrococcus sp. NG-SE-24]|uniref:diacylglycerol/lipid kinase family protein n=1 Tax=Halomicrococcus sp. NG-SE-24 TaxID=3436928 RepID=UPI003D97E3D8